MSADPQFGEFIERLREGDEVAASEFVRRYEPEIRRFVRIRLTTPSVRKFVDSVDVSQSVLGQFFVKLRDGDLEVLDARRLRNLLLTLASNKVRDKVRREHSGKRDSRRMAGDNELTNLSDDTATPSDIVEKNELIELIRGELTNEEISLLDERQQGSSWAEIAERCGVSADAARKRLARAVDAAAAKLGILDA